MIKTFAKQSFSTALWCHSDGYSHNGVGFSIGSVKAPTTSE